MNIKKEPIQSICEELKHTLTEEIRQELVNDIRNELMKEIMGQRPDFPQLSESQVPDQIPPLSYAAVASDGPKQRPTLIIKSKKQNTRPYQIKSQLNILSKEDDGLLNTRG